MNSWCLKVVISVLCVRILQKPELAGEINIEELGKLLPKELLEPLEDQFLSKLQVTWAAAVTGVTFAATEILYTDRYINV